MGGVAKAVKKAVDVVLDKVNPIVDPLYKLTGKVVRSAIRIVEDTADFIKAVVKGVINIIKTGNIADIAIVVVLAYTGQWQMLANYAIARVAIPAVTAAAADMGWISQETAMYLNIAGSLAVAYFNPAGMLGIENAAGGLAGGISSGLQGMGVSAPTATTIASQVVNIGAYAAIGYTVYGIYQTLEMVKNLQMQYLAAIAAFEAWKADFERARSVSEGNHIEAMSFATGEYYKRLPGQDLYNIFMPGREAYVCMEAVRPAYWVENRISPFTADREIVSITWDEFLPLEDRFGLK